MFSYQGNKYSISRDTERVNKNMSFFFVTGKCSVFFAEAKIITPTAEDFYTAIRLDTIFTRDLIERNKSVDIDRATFSWSNKVKIESFLVKICRRHVKVAQLFRIARNLIRQKFCSRFNRDTDTNCSSLSFCSEKRKRICNFY